MNQPGGEVRVADTAFRIDPDAGDFPIRGADGGTTSFWQRVRDGRWEADVFAFLSGHLRDGGTFLDIGAWIGPFSLLAASLGSRVVAVEPDPVAASRLLANRAANPGFDIALVSAAFHPAGGPLRLFSKTFGDSETSIHADRRRSDHDVRASASLLTGTVTAGDLLALAGGRIDVLKIDIEGGEFPAAAAIAELIDATSRAFVVSLHPENVYDAAGRFDAAGGRAKVLAFLEAIDLTGEVEWTAAKQRFRGRGDELLTFAAARGEEIGTVFVERA